jgi:ABC-2 type transport system permease protein
MVQTIYILWLRQIKRYLRSRSRIIGSLGQPVLFMVALGFGFGPIYTKAGGGDYFSFLVPGIIAMSVLFTSMFAGIEVVWDKQFGFLKETLVAPVSRFHIMLGRSLGGATIATMQGTIVLCISFFFGFRLGQPLLFLPALAFMFLVALVFTSFGTAIASKMDDMHGFQLIMNFIIMPTFFLSGSLFPLTDLPPALSVATKINPLTYGVDGLRHMLIQGGHMPWLFDLAVLSILSVIMISIGSYFFSRIQI